MLSMFLICGIIFFSTIMYYLERDEPMTDFYSIPASCWWCVVTMATVGYGDAKPVTTCKTFTFTTGHWLLDGKLVATATSICGIIVLAFPISMIVEKFANAQQKAIEEEQLHQGTVIMTEAEGETFPAQMSAVANNVLLRRFPTRRKIRRDIARNWNVIELVSPQPPILVSQSINFISLLNSTAVVSAVNWLDERRNNGILFMFPTGKNRRGFDTHTHKNWDTCSIWHTATQHCAFRYYATLLINPGCFPSRRNISQ